MAMYVIIDIFELVIYIGNCIVIDFDEKISVVLLIILWKLYSQNNL